jgi:hypothetical protein
LSQAGEIPVCAPDLQLALPALIFLLDMRNIKVNHCCGNS